MAAAAAAAPTSSSGGLTAVSAYKRRICFVAQFSSPSPVCALVIYVGALDDVGARASTRASSASVAHPSARPAAASLRAAAPGRRCSAREGGTGARSGGCTPQREKCARRVFWRGCSRAIASIAGSSSTETPTAAVSSCTCVRAGSCACGRSAQGWVVAAAGERPARADRPRRRQRASKSGRSRRYAVVLSRCAGDDPVSALDPGNAHS